VFAGTQYDRERTLALTVPATLLAQSNDTSPLTLSGLATCCRGGLLRQGEQTRNYATAQLSVPEAEMLRRDMAEGVRFELTRRFPVCRFSRPVP
jgi:hypothetical protein